MTAISARSHFVDRHPVRLHHLDWGNEGAHPIVLVHGSRLHAHVWNHFCRRFKDRFHIIAVDQRGHGDSGWCPEGRYELEVFYEDLRAVIRARGLGRFTLVGHSLGGRVSMLYAHRHPEDLERLILVDITPGRPANASPNADISRVAETPPPRDFDSHDEASAYLQSIMTRAPAEVVDESVRHGMRRIDGGKYTWKYDPAMLRRSRAATTSGIDMWAVVQGITTPTLLQYGGASQVVNKDLAERMVQTMPKCSAERIDDAGHGLYTDQPEAFAASVERFLSTLPQ
jgi:pimeloyl-ACP methyl ester carboxylesterase